VRETKVSLAQQVEQIIIDLKVMNTKTINPLLTYPYRSHGYGLLAFSKLLRVRAGDHSSPSPLNLPTYSVRQCNLFDGRHYEIGAELYS